MTALLAGLRQRFGRLLPGWMIALAAFYVTLIPVLRWLEPVPGVSVLLGLTAAVCFLVWYARQERFSQLRLPGPLMARAFEVVRGLPPVILWLPLPVSLSWVAAVMARVDPSRADYDAAFALWAGALIVFVAIFLAPLAAENRRRLSGLVQKIASPEVAAVTLITAVALAARLIDLGNEPSPFWVDEAEQALAGIEVVKGFRPNFLDMGGGTTQPALYYATHALFFQVFGASVFAARLPAAIVGTITVPLLYLLLRELFNRRVAFVGAAFLAVLHFHVHYSRMAFPNVYDALFVVVILYFAFRAIRTGAFVDFALAGLAAGLVAYFYAGGRVVLAVLMLLLAYTALRTRGAFIFRNFWGLSVLATGLVVSIFPAALYFHDKPENLNSRFEAENIFDSGWLDSQQEITGHSELHILWDQVQQSFGTLVVYGDGISHYNAGVPLLDAASSVFFVIGGVYALLRFFQPRFLTLFAVFILALVLGGALLIPPIASNRLLSTAPVTATFVALGVFLVAEAAAKALPQIRWLGPAVIGGALLLIAFVNLEFYFRDYLPSDNFGAGGARAPAAAARYLDSFDDNYAVYFYGSPGFNARNNTLRFLARDKMLVEVTEDGRADPYVGGIHASAGEAAAAKAKATEALALFVVERLAELRDLEAVCPGGIERVVEDEAGQNVLVSYELPIGHICLDKLTLSADRHLLPFSRRH